MFATFTRRDLSRKVSDYLTLIRISQDSQADEGTINDGHNSREPLRSKLHRTSKRLSTFPILTIGFPMTMSDLEC